MFIELIDLLRCPHPHEDGWLVLAPDEIVDRHVIRGTLGCPVCAAECPIVDGEADLRRDRSVGAPRPDHMAAAGNEDAVVRLAALLGLGDAEGRVALTGRHAALAAALQRLTTVEVLAVNGPDDRPWHVSAIRCEGALPVAPASLRGLALDEVVGGQSGGRVELEPSIGALRAGARVVAPAAMMVPEGVRVLARDEHSWVGELERVAGPLVSLTRPDR